MDNNNDKRENKIIGQVIVSFWDFFCIYFTISICISRGLILHYAAINCTAPKCTELLWAALSSCIFCAVVTICVAVTWPGVSGRSAFCAVHIVHCALHNTLHSALSSVCSAIYTTRCALMHQLLSDCRIYAEHNSTHVYTSMQQRCDMCVRQITIIGYMFVFMIATIVQHLRTPTCVCA